PQVVSFQDVALLDVSFDVGEILARIADDARPASQTCAVEGIAQLDTACGVEGFVDLLLGEVAAEGPAADKATEMALLVCPRPHIHDLAGKIRVGTDRTCRFEPVDQS